MLIQYSSPHVAVFSLILLLRNIPGRILATMITHSPFVATESATERAARDRASMVPDRVSAPN
ncbi:unnamed protein product [Ectocarpus sp. CCAP 1310/34]|nr:unnamed protein product [Ectocarpus sp. CCAP 1310/34]